MAERPASEEQGKLFTREGDLNPDARAELHETTDELPSARLQDENQDLYGSHRPTTTIDNEDERDEPNLVESSFFLPTDNLLENPIKYHQLLAQTDAAIETRLAEIGAVSVDDKAASEDQRIEELQRTRTKIAIAFHVCREQMLKKYGMGIVSRFDAILESSKPF